MAKRGDAELTCWNARRLPRRARISVYDRCKVVYEGFSAAMSPRECHKRCAYLSPTLGGTNRGNVTELFPLKFLTAIWVSPRFKRRWLRPQRDQFGVNRPPMGAPRTLGVI